MNPHLVHPALQPRQPPGGPAGAVEPAPRAPSGPPTDENEIREFPRPLLPVEAPPARHETQRRYEEVPSLLCEYDCPDLANAPARYVRSSANYLPDSSAVFGRAGVPLTLTFTPLADPGPEDAPVLCAVKPGGFVLRCERCRAFAAPAFAFRDNWKRYVCHLCGLESAVDARYTDPAGLSPELFPETVHAVADNVMPESTKLATVRGNDILICLDFSFEALSSGAFAHCLSSVRSSLDGLDAHTSLGFALWDATVSFFKFGPEDEEPFVSRCADSATPVAGVAPAEVFLHAERQREELLRVIDFFEQLGERRLREHATELRNTPHCLEQLVLVLTDFFAEQAGHVLLFASAHRKRPNEPVRYPAGEKLPPFRPRAPELAAVAERLAARSVSLDLFVTVTQPIELASISELALRTGGTVFFYDNFRLAAHAERLFYDIYRALTVPRVSDVAVRLRHSPGLHVLDYLTPRGPVAALDFQLPSLTADQTLTAQLHLAENLRDLRRAHFQLAVLYTTSAGQRRLRTINLALQITAEVPLFFKQLNCEPLVVSWLRAHAWRLRQAAPGEVVEGLMRAVEKLFRYYRFDVGGKYEPRDFALPDRLKHLPLYIASALGRPCLHPRAGETPDAQFATLLDLLQLSPAKLLCLLYPKLFDLDRLGDAQPGSSVSATQRALRMGAAYLADDGRELLLVADRQTDPELLEGLFGTVETEPGDPGPPLLPAEASEVSQRVHALVDRLRAIKGGSVQPLRTVMEESLARGQLRRLLVEDAPTPFSPAYWSFLIHLHDHVKAE